jgi:REP element-mobilizing transposase RayT
LRNARKTEPRRRVMRSSSSVWRPAAGPFALLLVAARLHSWRLGYVREDGTGDRTATKRSGRTTYLITFACYGCHLHGDEAGSVDRLHNLPGSRMLEPNARRASAELQRMDQAPYEMDSARREVVVAAVRERCQQQQWRLLAAHVRTNHVHLVVDGEDRPERIMNAVKSYASRCLNRLGWDEPARKRWARHGSTRWLWKAEDVSAAIRYVVDEQGEPMAVFEATEG